MWPYVRLAMCVGGNCICWKTRRLLLQDPTFLKITCERACVMIAHVKLYIVHRALLINMTFSSFSSYSILTRARDRNEKEVAAYQTSLSPLVSGERENYILYPLFLLFHNYII